MATETEINAGATALKAFVDKTMEARGMGFAEGMVPANDFVTGASDVIKAADASQDQSPAARQSAGQAALRAALNTTDQGDRVNDAQCASGTEKILAAVAAVRGGPAAE